MDDTKSVSATLWCRYCGRPITRWSLWWEKMTCQECLNEETDPGGLMRLRQFLAATRTS